MAIKITHNKMLIAKTGNVIKKERKTSLNPQTNIEYPYVFLQNFKVFLFFYNNFINFFGFSKIF